VALGKIYCGQCVAVTFIEDRVSLWRIYRGQSGTGTDL